MNIATYNNIIKNGYLIVGYDDCIVYDAIDIKLCYQCCGYHHYYKQCSNKLPICPKCSGSHNVKECKTEVLQCVNCTSLNTKHQTNLSVDHTVWDFSKCHAYQKAQSDFKSSILSVK